MLRIGFARYQTMRSRSFDLFSQFILNCEKTVDNTIENIVAENETKGGILEKHKDDMFILDLLGKRVTQE